MSNLDSALDSALDEKFDLSSSLSTNPSNILENQIETLEEGVDKLECEPQYVSNSAKMTIVDRIKAYHRDLKLKKLKFKLNKLYDKRKEDLLAITSNKHYSTPNMSGTSTPISYIPPPEPNSEKLLADAMNQLADLHEKRRRARSIWASKEERNLAYKINAQYEHVQSNIHKLRKAIAEHSFRA